jgi:hypothetical protein
MFQDWVIPHLKKADERLNDNDSNLHIIKEANFNFLKEKNIQHRRSYIEIAELLFRDLYCNFTSGKKIKHPNCQNFTFIFCSVIANLKKEVFDKLRNSKNTFYVYGHERAFVKRFDLEKLNITIDKEEKLKVVGFSHELGDVKHYKELQECWLFGRWAVAHELGHILFPSYDEDKINKKVAEWDFNKEIEIAFKIKGNGMRQFKKDLLSHSKVKTVFQEDKS